MGRPRQIDWIGPPLKICLSLAGHIDCSLDMLQSSPSSTCRGAGKITVIWAYEWLFFLVRPEVSGNNIPNGKFSLVCPFQPGYRNRFDLTDGTF
jgi:hypothetical protein